MAPKRAAVPGDAFNKSSSALDKLTGRAASPPDQGAGEQNTVVPQNRNTVLPQNRNTVLPKTAADAEAREKVSFYLRPEQVDKLEELSHAYRKRTGKRINRNELVRRLIDRAVIDLLLADTEGTG